MEPPAGTAQQVAIAEPAADLAFVPAPAALLVCIALLPFGLGYFLSYLYRATNAVVAPDLVREVGLTAAQLGLMTAAYLFAFAAFQLPLGILLDRYGPRRVQAALVAVGGAGALLFSMGHSVTTLLVARAIIGLGFCGGLMSAFKAVVIWVPEQRRPLANALVMSVGALGLIVATTPLELAVQAAGWRSVFLAMSVFTFAVAALILLVVPERAAAAAPATTPPATFRQEVREIIKIARDPVYLALAPLLAIVTGVHVAIQTLWAGPWLRDVAGLVRNGVANRLFLMAAAFLAGILLSGMITDRLTRRGVSLLHIMLGFLAIFFAAQLGLMLEVEGLDIWLWTAFSMTGQVSVLSFPWLGSYYGARLSGRANSAVNLPMFGMAFICQYAIGAVIDLFPPTPSGGYAPEAYRVAFAWLLLAEGLAFTWYGIHWQRIAKADAIVLAAYRARFKTA